MVPEYYFSYLGFGWVRPWPEWGMYLHFVCLDLLGLAVAAGLLYRVSIVLFFLGFMIDRVTYLNHYYWISLVLALMLVRLTVTGCFDFDLRLVVRAGDPGGCPATRGSLDELAPSSKPGPSR